jgi:hypothetical protein
VATEVTVVLYLLDEVEVWDEAAFEQDVGDMLGAWCRSVAIVDIQEV